MMMGVTWMIILVAFVMAASLAAVVGLLSAGRNRRLKARLQDLSGGNVVQLEQNYTQAISAVVKSALPKMGSPLLPEDEAGRTLLKARMIHAGLYNPHAIPIFLGVKFLLMVTPAILGLAGGVVGFFPLNYGLIFGACAGIVGMIGPSFWLDRQLKKRQKLLRRALPDAIDLIVICMEGGLSLSGALRRVVGELRTAHPLLADEFNIVQREVQLGQPLAASLASFASRSVLAEIKTLSGVVKSAEQFGSSMVKSLQNYSEALRLQRQQSAEVMAQKASTKILFPTLLFIFPSILIIILGPAAIQIVEVMNNLRRP